MGRANEDLLAQIHEKLAKRFLEKLNSGEELTAQELSAIGKFLKDNDITATPEQGTTIAFLKSSLDGFDAEAAGFRAG